MTTPLKAAILLVDDHAIVRHGLAALFNAADDLLVVAETGDGSQAGELARQWQPQVVLLDLLMPGMDGVATIGAIKAAHPSCRIAVLTSSEDESLAFAAIEAGAHSFLLKSMSGAELLHAVRQIVRDEVVVHPVVARLVLEAMRRIKQPAANPFSELSARELDVLRALAAGASNARLGAALAISEKTVKSHISSILSKLNLSDRTEAVAFAWRNGLMQPPGVSTHQERLK
ncbi:MAG: response regulator transcription factor [Pseudomonadota bacterium]|nr:response regulator transcription factor [Pseudomonadota bacterium]